MCGINGITKKDSSLVEEMNNCTAHRGPDATSIFESEGITLGHNRLAIIDLSDDGIQPMHSCDGRYVVVFNGEIYNYRELRDELSNSYAFKTATDTEVLLAAYTVWGETFLNKLKGIFAFALWDSEVKSLLLARDHMGVKPLYYRHEHGVLTFSSELGALLLRRINVLDVKSFNLYLNIQYAPSPHTPVQGVVKLPAGHVLKYEKGTCTVTPYSPYLIPKKEEKPRTSLVETIDSAVKRQLVSDRPVGIFLSGGLDSSIVLHHASKYLSLTRTYSVAFEMIESAQMEGKKFNTDAELAARTAKVYGADHTTFTITLEDLRKNLLNIIESIDEPIANPTAISQYFLSKWTREDGIVVALGGDGGDELFGGYTRHRMAMLAYYYQKIPTSMRKMIDHVYPRAQKLDRPFDSSFHLEFMALKKGVLNSVLKPEFRSETATVDFFNGLYALYAKVSHPVDTFSYVDRRTWLPDESLMRSDKTSMRHGLELRVPLLDVDVVRYADTISILQKTSPFLGKKIIRNEYQNILPEYLFVQPKRGWISPGAKWFRDPVINEFVMHVFSDAYYDGLSAAIDWEAVRKMLKRHVAHEEYRLYPLWNLMVLQIWAKKNTVHSGV